MELTNQVFLTEYLLFSKQKLTTNDGQKLLFKDNKMYTLQKNIEKRISPKQIRDQFPHNTASEISRIQKSIKEICGNDIITKGEEIQKKHTGQEGQQGQSPTYE